MFSFLEDYIAEEVITTTETSPAEDVEMTIDSVSNDMPKVLDANITDEAEEQSYGIYSQFLSSFKLIICNTYCFYLSW